ncbi:hypothetical protein PVAP13_2NG423503 [Panicum virgatum]|uniref:Uncharacterized protein n=1 Tax=Panicum virgatum TaxID=38727 RepID=A0A8T0VNR5_PANVG|nr:hypothetical protein PVAP13_2NG423503 [Panicum virgatum]
MFTEGAGAPSPARRLALPRRSRSGAGSWPALLEPLEGPGCCCCATPAAPLAPGRGRSGSSADCGDKLGPSWRRRRWRQGIQGRGEAARRGVGLRRGAEG